MREGHSISQISCFRSWLSLWAGSILKDRDMGLPTGNMVTAVYLNFEDVITYNQWWQVSCINL